MKPVTGNFTGYRLTDNRFTTIESRDPWIEKSILGIPDLEIAILNPIQNFIVIYCDYGYLVSSY